MTISLSGLDLSFLKDNPLPMMPKKQRNRINSKRSSLPAPMVMRDVDQAYGGDGIVSPIDHSVITSRSQLRRHNNTHQVDQCGDVALPDYLSHIEKVRDVGTVNPKEVSFEWTHYEK